MRFLTTSAVERQGGLVFFGNHSNDGLLYEVLDEDGKLVVNVTMELLIADWKANT